VTEFLGHDWLRAVAVAEEAVELMPGDLRRPRRLGTGQGVRCGTGLLNAELGERVRRKPSVAATGGKGGARATRQRGRKRPASSLKRSPDDGTCWPLATATRHLLGQTGDLIHKL